MEALRIALLMISFSFGCFPVMAAKIETRSTKAGTAIIIEGELQPNDQKSFHDKVLGLDSGFVFFDSPGGNLLAGIEIGKAIRLKGLSTFVLDDALCASACALAWLGGKTRFAGSQARIAFHAAWVLKGGKKVETGAGNALVGAYLNALGLSDDAIVFFTMAPPDGAERLTFERAERLGFRVVEIPTSAAQERSEPRMPLPSVPSPQAPTVETSKGPSPQLQAAPPIVVEAAATPLPNLTPRNWWHRPEEPEMVPQVLDLASLDAAAQVQRRLEERGYFRGLVDGVWGPRSRIALRDFKSQNRLARDDSWDLRTQLALFNDGYQIASLDYIPNSVDMNGLYNPFVGRPGTRFHPLNPGDATSIQDQLYRLSYYRKQGDGIWGIASRSALIDFKVANGLAADDRWDASVEETMRAPHVVPAADTPFGDWVLSGISCNSSEPHSRLAVSAKYITAGSTICHLEPPLQRTPDGWGAIGRCNRGTTVFAARIHFETAKGNLFDRSILGTGSNPKPPSYQRCN